MKTATISGVLATLSLVLAVSSCGDPKKSARGFRLPDGNVDEGKAAFVSLSCHRCHTVEGVDFPAYEGESPLTVKLGGEVQRVKNYGELVTSIINPSHVVSSKYLAQLPTEEREEAGKDSPMPSFNDTMTVAQMTDLVAFLQSRYEKLEPYYDPYL